MNLSANIAANVGKVDGFALQNNGTNRIKGSFPHLITDESELFDHLTNEIKPLIEQYSVEKLSRLSLRYFITESAVQKIRRKLHNFSLSQFYLQLEAAVNFGDIFYHKGVKEDIFWVWIGGNTQERKTDPEIMADIISHFHNELHYKNPYYFKLPPNNYEIQLLGTNERLKHVNKDILPSYVTVKEIHNEDARQIAELYGERLPVYVARNDNPDYVINAIANSNNTFLFVARNKINGPIDAVMANELTRYPLSLPGNQKVEVAICESNDWIKRKDASQGVFTSLLTVGMINAYLLNPHCIEVECVPEAIHIAGKMGFEPTPYPLERTSHMKTDGKNMELYDESIPQEFRQFNSLCLLTVTSTTLGKKLPHWLLSQVNNTHLLE